MSTELFDPIKTMAKVTDSVIVGLSFGKESICVMDLCARYFEHVYPYFMYNVPHMSFDERAIEWYQGRYGVEIDVLPHFQMGEMLRYGAFREPDFDVPAVSINDVYSYERGRTGACWVAAGERVDDSIIRRAMILHSGSIDRKRGRFYPLAYWSKRDVYDYIKFHRLYVNGFSRKTGHSFSGLDGKQVESLKRWFPDDYEKCKEFWPFVGAGAKRRELWGV